MATQTDHDTDARSWLRPGVRDLPAYEGPKTAADVGAGKARLLHLNESPYPPSPRAIEAIRNFGDRLNRYPDIHARALADALSAGTGMPADRIVFGAGADELVQLVCGITTDPGDAAVMPWPTFPPVRVDDPDRGRRGDQGAPRRSRRQ